VWVPDRITTALRILLAREAAKNEQLRARPPVE